MARTNGTSTWVDLSTHDLDATKAFYSGLFGWTFEDQGEEFGHYQLVRNGDALVGGAMDVSAFTSPDCQPLPSAWGVFLSVDDADSTVATAKESGVQIFSEPMDVGAMGRMAILADPTGAQIGLWQPKELDGYDFTGTPGSPVWFELMTPKYDAAAEFYTSVLGADLTPMAEPMESEWRYSTNGSAEQASWGLGDATGVMPDEAAGWRVYFGVASSDEAIAKITELGGTILDGPVDSPFGRIATVADPGGATFQICAMSEAVPEG